MPTTMEEIGAPSCWTTEYWLGHCEGYRVFTDEGPIGFVEEVLWEANEEPTALVVRVGEAFAHLLTVPVEAVEGFDPAGERVFIGSLADLGPEAFGRQLRIPTAV